MHRGVLKILPNRALIAYMSLVMEDSVLSRWSTSESQTSRLIKDPYAN